MPILMVRNMSSINSRNYISRLFEFQIEETSSGRIVSARIDAQASEEEVRAIYSEIINLTPPEVEALSRQLTLPTRRNVRSSLHRFVMATNSDTPTVRSISDVQSFGEDEGIEVDNLIPVPPDRPSGKISVKLNSSGRDKPVPAEDPWAD